MFSGRRLLVMSATLDGERVSGVVEDQATSEYDVSARVAKRPQVGGPQAVEAIRAAVDHNRAPIRLNAPRVAPVNEVGVRLGNSTNLQPRQRIVQYDPACIEERRSQQEISGLSDDRPAVDKRQVDAVHVDPALRDQYRVNGNGPEIDELAADIGK